MNTINRFYMLLLAMVAAMSVHTVLAQDAELSEYDMNAPMGWATCKSLTTAGDYELT